MKPGFKTTEFLTTVAWIIAAGTGLILPFFLDGDHTAVQITAGIVGLLKGAGYDWSRTSVKKEDIKANAHIAAVEKAASAPLQK